MPTCDNCGCGCDPEELRELAGKQVCEDCFLDGVEMGVQYLVNRVNAWLRRITDMGAVPRGLAVAVGVADLARIALRGGEAGHAGSPPADQAARATSSLMSNPNRSTFIGAWLAAFRTSK